MRARCTWMAANSPEEWYRGLPVITRGYMTASFAATILTQMEFISPTLLHLDFNALMSSFELWRLVTNFCFFGKFGLPFVFSMFFLLRYGKELEMKRFEGRSADMLWCLVLTGLLQIVVAFLLGEMPFLSKSRL